MGLAFIISLIAAVIPASLYTVIFYWVDRYEREPVWLVVTAFLWGAVPAIIVSIIGELLLGSPFVNAPGSVAEALVEGAVVAPVVEEIVKGVMLVAIFLFRRQEFDGPLDGLIYGAAVGMGFAMTENLLYFVDAFDAGGYGNLTIVIFLRAVIFGLNHAFYTGLTGIGLGVARLYVSRGVRWFWALFGLGAAITAHALHNFGVSIIEYEPSGLLLSLVVAALGFIAVILTILLSWRYERNCIRVELRNEIGYVLTDAEYQRLTRSWFMPMRYPKRGPRGYPTREARDAAKEEANRMQLYAELALGKHRLRLLGDQREEGLVEYVASLRARLTAPETLGTTN
ncbi:MAG: PrsW family intramembrane metalloprotease [Chloroflexota bacterium]